MSDGAQQADHLIDELQHLRQQVRQLEGERARIQERVDLQVRLLTSVVQSIGFPLYVIDAATYEVLLTNPATVRHGIPAETTCHALAHHRAEPCNGPEGSCPLQRVQATKQPVVTEHIHFDQDGNTRHVEIHALPVLDDSGTVAQMIEYNVDITDRKRIEDELRNHKRSLEMLVCELERSNVELKEFTSVAAHNIRSPMASILESAVLLRESLQEKLDEEEKMIFDILTRGIDRTTDMIGALYGCCQVDSGPTSPTDVDLTKIVDELRTIQLRLDLRKTGGTITVSQPLHHVRGDEVQILGLMQNLIANGLKYHRDGVPPVVTIRSSTIGGGRIRIEVEDNGIGIREADRKAIFNMFHRLDDARGREGLGIGLAYCERIAERHGGRIGVRSTYGSGSIFWVELPRANS